MGYSTEMAFRYPTKIDTFRPTTAACLYVLEAKFIIIIIIIYYYKRDFQTNLRDSKNKKFQGKKPVNQLMKIARHSQRNF